MLKKLALKLAPTPPPIGQAAVFNIVCDFHKFDY